MDPATAYFLKKYYPHVIKWWLVVYNPETVRIWPSKAEKDAALRLEAIEAKKEAENKKSQPAHNATTGSYSGLYGQKPVDENTQAALDAILSASNNQNSVDSLLAGGTSSGEIVTLPPEQDEIVREANEIYERLLREAAEDEARKQAEIDEMRRQAELQFG